MKRILPLLSVALLLCVSCRKNADPVVAQVYQYKLYASEVQADVPLGLSQEDSITLVRDFIDNWVKEKLVLHEAERHLSPREKNFDREMTEYRNSLLAQRYLDKIWQKDTANNAITDKEITDFARSLDDRYTVEKEIVRVNYVKMPTRSDKLPLVRDILFDERQRDVQKETLVSMLGDTIEYLLDDDEWLYLDDLQNEVAFQIDVQKLGNRGSSLRIEKEVGENTVLLVILDYRSQRSVNDTKDERAAAGMLLMNQRRTRMINQYVQTLYDKALKEGKIVQ
ncbi:MAG: hypothetical protein IKO75_13550 [Bacteroidales bacterium]|nr:hypothetical protein [Bacteroidales bacterium]